MTTETTPFKPDLLHRLLGISLGATAVVFVGLTYFGFGPTEPAGAPVPLILFGPSVVAVGVIAVALLMFKPRVPDRAAGQTLGEYWSVRQVGENVSVLWFLLEGAGILAAVGYFLNHAPASLIPLALAIAALWWCRPGSFTNE